jgi:hypothetical protein
VVKICARCLVAWPGGYRCDQCGGPLTHTSDARAKGLPEVVWRNQRVDYGARRGMVFRFQAIFLGFLIAVLGVRYSVGLSSPWAWPAAAASIAGGVLIWWLLHEAADRAVKVWVLRKGQLSKRKLARVLLGQAVASAKRP